MVKSIEPLMTVVITKREDQADNIAVLDFKTLDGTELPAFEAGAHIDVHIGPDLVRQYSLCNNPDDSSVYRIAVLKEPESRGGSETIFAQFKEGDKVEISAPRNLFPLTLTEKKSILIGGGIGITPMVAMAHTLKKKNLPFELHYCLRKKSEGAMVSYLESNFAPFLHFHTSREGDCKRIDLDKVLKPVEPGVEVYICGSGSLLDSLIAYAKDLGFAKEQIHFEYFNAEVDISGESFEVYCADSDITVNVGAEESIATALKREGVQVSVSCEEGICGTCISDVLEGEPDHRDHFLSDEEKEDNDQIALCCSRSKSKRLVVDI